MKRIVKYLTAFNTRSKAGFYIPGLGNSERPVNHLSSEAFTSYLSVLGHKDIYYNENKGWMKMDTGKNENV